MIKRSQIFAWLFILLPFIEIAGFVIIGGKIGVIATMLVVIFSAVFGFALIRTEGWRHLRGLQQRIEAGENPELESLDAMLIFLAGFLLIIPGFITDFLAILLLIPPLRKHLIKGMAQKGMVQKNQIKGHTFEGEFTRDEKDD